MARLGSPEAVHIATVAATPIPALAAVATAAGASVTGAAETVGGADVQLLSGCCGAAVAVVAIVVVAVTPAVVAAEGEGDDSGTFVVVVVVLPACGGGPSDDVGSAVGGAGGRTRAKVTVGGSDVDTVRCDCVALKRVTDPDRVRMVFTFSAPNEPKHDANAATIASSDIVRASMIS